MKMRKLTLILLFTVVLMSKTMAGMVVNLQPSDAAIDIKVLNVNESGISVIADVEAILSKRVFAAGDESVWQLADVIRHAFKFESVDASLILDRVSLEKSSLSRTRDFIEQDISHYRTKKSYEHIFAMDLKPIDDQYALLNRHKLKNF